MNQDELAQWLADYMRPRYQVFGPGQRVIVGIHLTDLGKMAEALLEAMEPSQDNDDCVHCGHPEGRHYIPYDRRYQLVCAERRCLCTTKNPSTHKPARSQPDVMVREICEMCGGYVWPPTSTDAIRCSNCNGLGYIDTAVPLEGLLDDYFRMKGAPIPS